MGTEEIKEIFFFVFWGITNKRELKVIKPRP